MVKVQHIKSILSVPRIYVSGSLEYPCACAIGSIR